MFEITGVNVSEALIAVVMATGYENPLTSVHEIEKRLSVILGNSQATGEVLFDLLCSNGPEWNRFVSLEIRCGSILLDTAKIVDEQEIPAQILRHQRDVLRNHPEYVEDSVLTPDDVLCIL